MVKSNNNKATKNKLIKKLFYILTTIHKITAQVLEYSETDLETDTGIAGTGDFNSADRTRWIKDAGATPTSNTIRVCDTTPNTYTKLVMSFWYKTASPTTEINIGEPQTTMGGMTIPHAGANELFTFSDPGNCMKITPGTKWRFIMYIFDSICSPGNYKIVRPKETITPCTMVDDPIIYFDFPTIAGSTGSKDFSINGGTLIVKRVILTEQRNTLEVGLDALVFSTGFPEVINRIYWPIFDNTLTPLVAGGNQEAGLKRLTPAGVVMLPESNEVIEAKFQVDPSTDPAKSYSVFHKFMFQVNGEGDAKEALKGKTVSLEIVISPRVDRYPLGISELKNRYTARIEMEFNSNNLDLAWKIFLSRETDTDTILEKEITFPGGYTNTRAFTPSLEHNQRIYITVTFQIIAIVQGKVILKVVLHQVGDNPFGPPLSSVTMFDITDSLFDADQLYISSYTYYRFKSDPTPTPALKDTIRLYLEKTVTTFGGYAFNVPSIKTTSCEIQEGYRSLGICVFCLPNYKLQNPEGPFDTDAALPICEGCSTIGSGFGACSACTEHQKCYSSDTLYNYFYEPKIPASQMMPTKNSESVNDCNGNKDYNFNFYYVDGMTNNELDFGSCLPCEATTCYCNRFQNELNHPTSGNKMCECKLENCN